MEKLRVVTSYFDRIREDDDHTVYTEEMITNVLQNDNINILQYDEVSDMPSSIVNDALAEITGVCLSV